MGFILFCSGFLFRDLVWARHGCHVWVPLKLMVDFLTSCTLTFFRFALRMQNYFLRISYCVKRTIHILIQLTFFVLFSEAPDPSPEGSKAFRRCKAQQGVWRRKARQGVSEAQGPAGAFGGARPGRGFRRCKAQQGLSEAQGPAREQKQRSIVFPIFVKQTIQAMFSCFSKG